MGCVGLYLLLCVRIHACVGGMGGGYGMVVEGCMSVSYSKFTANQ